MSFPRTAVIAAAGLGSRLGLNIPKCLVEIKNKTLLAYQLELLKEIEEVRVVVGYREDDVIREVIRERPDALIVRNSQYQTTTNTDSLRLATLGLNRSYVYIDGDIWVEQQSFKKFIQACAENETIVGMTDCKSDEAIYVDLNEDGSIRSFSASAVTPFEWSGIAYISDRSRLDYRQGYIFETLTPSLPLRGFKIDSWEIDTPTDLDRLRRYINQVNEEH